MKLGNHEAAPVFPSDPSTAWDLVLRSPTSPTVKMAAAIYLCWPPTAHPLPKNTLQDARYDVIEWGRRGFNSLVSANVPLLDILATGNEAYLFLEQALHLYEVAEESAAFLEKTPKPL